MATFTDFEALLQAVRTGEHPDPATNFALVDTEIASIEDQLEKVVTGLNDSVKKLRERVDALEKGSGTG